jgi:deoxyribodipyrimidine photo-lyase
MSIQQETQSKANAPGAAIVWFRNDLRVADNPALLAAAMRGGTVICCYILDEETPGMRAMGGAQKWMLHHGLAALSKKLGELGQALLLRRGAAKTVLEELRAETDADAVYWNRRYGPGEIEADSDIKAQLAQAGVEARSFDGSLLHEPTLLRTGAGQPFRVYSPFWRAFEASGEPRQPRGEPQRLQAPAQTPRSDRLEDWELLPTKPDWAQGLREAWPAGEDGARQMLTRFLKDGLEGYADGRDFPALPHVSRLSPYLRFGMISPHQVWHAARDAGAPQRDTIKFLKELGWREFSFHLLFFNRELSKRNFSSGFDVFPWKWESDHVEAWKRGRTGYPIVDAGMRELWATGWMHNRVRMIVASFLVKHLLVHWRVGEEWFWDTLVDGDPANNAASWQWVAGCGADAAPYFRVFNPMLQGEKFDPDGEYVKKWVPELAKLHPRHVHAPWEAPSESLAQAGIRLGRDYPRPIVDHQKARDSALQAFQSIRKAG